MSRLQAIEQALENINGAVYQELCDSYLKAKNIDYRAFSRVGSQSGKQKTTKGTPDTFFMLSQGQYLFVEITTDRSTKNKLQKDIESCFEFKKTKIPIEKIKEIILCFNWNINPQEVHNLYTTVEKFSKVTKARFYTLQDMALDIHLNRRDLAHEYLELPIDTGQIVSMESFIHEYGKASGGIATPLDNTFMHREKELKDIKLAIQEHDFVILTGAPGVGKTKLALQATTNFVSENLSFQAFCVSYKHYTLIEDMYQYFDHDQDYILFVDDANRIDAFNQIIGFYRVARHGKFKIVLTVRDYAFQDISLLCQEFNSEKVDIYKFTDDQIIDIIKADPFKVLNSDFHREIIRIADGNPRIALMAARLAKAQQDIHVLRDVSNLFECYFSTFIGDNQEFANPLNLKCLGLVSFFFALPYKNKDVIEPILSDFGMPYHDFIDAIDKLDQLELIDIQFDYVKISEQNLATYFFYKSFIKDARLSFRTLLTNYFDKNTDRFRDCVIPANNTFGPENVMNNLVIDLKQFGEIIRNDQAKTLKFLSTFWFYLADQVMEFTFNTIKEFSAPPSTQIQLARTNNDFPYEQHKIIQLLSNFFNYPGKYFRDSLLLAFEYTRKRPESLPELIHQITRRIVFTREDKAYDYNRQFQLFDILISGLDKSDDILSASFFELSKTFLSFEYDHTKGGRNDTITMYRYRIPSNEQILQFRELIWVNILNKYSLHYQRAFDLLKDYSKPVLQMSNTILKSDIEHLVKIIDTCLDSNSFKHCKYVQEQINWLERNSGAHAKFDTLRKRFTNTAYEYYIVLTWYKYRDLELVSSESYQKYDELKEKSIRDYFAFRSKSDIDEFYKTVSPLNAHIEGGGKFNYSIDILIDQCFIENFKLGCYFLKKISESNNAIVYLPRLPFKNYLTSEDRIAVIWNVIHIFEFDHMLQWELSFFENLPKIFITQKYVNSLFQAIKEIPEIAIIDFNRLRNFHSVNSTTTESLLSIIYRRNCKPNAKFRIWDSAFSDHFVLLGSNINLIELNYLQQYTIQDHFDYEGKGFTNILKKDSEFLYRFVDHLFVNGTHNVSARYPSMTFVWKIDGIEKVLERILNLLGDKNQYAGFSEHFLNSFFKNLDASEEIRARALLLDYVSQNHSHVIKMNIVVDIIRNSLKDMYEEILLLFVSLNQDAGTFAKIWWRGNGGTVWGGDVIIADKELADWAHVQRIIEKSEIGINLLPIKSYVSGKIEYCQKRGNDERARRFLRRN